MLTSISQVNEEFFKLFSGIKIKDHTTGSEISVRSRFARKSAQDYVEEQENQVYPCIAIQDYQPTLAEDWWIDFKEYAGGLSTDNLTAYLYRRPIWMDFRYDVSIATKDYFQSQSLKNLFLSRFIAQPKFIFNRTVIDGDEVGDVVPYTIRTTDVPRTDGVLEVNYEFTLRAWLYVVEPREVDVVQQIVTELIQVDVEPIG